MSDIFNMADTWNAGGTTFTAIKMNVTDTASAGGSMLIDLQVATVSMFKVTKAGAATFANGATFGSNVFIPATLGYSWLDGTTIRNSSNGIIALYSSGSADFGRLQFGGTTSSFPSLKRSTTLLQGRLADDSAFCTIQGLLRTGTNAVAETPTATHTLLITDAAGTGYKVLAVAA